MAKKPTKKRSRSVVNVFGSRLQFFIRFVSWSLLSMVALMAVSLHIELWLLEIYVSYLPQIFLLAVTLYMVMVALYGRFIIRDGWQVCWKSIGVKEGAMFVFASIFTLYIVVYSLTIIKPVPANSIAHNLTVGTYNVLYTNKEIYRAAYFFASKNTDIVALQEATPEFIEEAKAILGHDYVESTDCDCSAGDTEVAIISKYPLSNTQVVVQHQNGAIIRTEAKVSSQTTIAVYALHIPPPFSQKWYNLRNQFTEQLAQKVSEDRLKTVVMGDFNTTIFSPSMQRFVEQTSSKVDNMSESSWPDCSWYGFGDIACARIDHIFVSRQFGIGKRYTGQGYGSDHRPLIVELLVN